MDNDLTRADDHLNYVARALDEVDRHLTTAAGVSVDNSDTRVQLGDALGQAHNALARASRDLASYRRRVQRHDDRDSAEAYLSQFGIASEDSYFEVLVLPLPLEDERLPVERLQTHAFERSVGDAILRFNDEERLTSHFLSEFPGSYSGTYEGELFHFRTYVQGDRGPHQQATIATNGAFAYNRKLFPIYETPRIYLAQCIEDVRLTLMLAQRLFVEWGFAPRSIALLCRLRNIRGSVLMTPGPLRHPTTMYPKADLDAFDAPATTPLVLSGTIEQWLTRALPAIDRAIRSHYGMAESDQ